MGDLFLDRRDFAQGNFWLLLQQGYLRHHRGGQLQVVRDFACDDKATDFLIWVWSSGDRLAVGVEEVVDVAPLGDELGVGPNVICGAVPCRMGPST